MNELKYYAVASDGDVPPGEGRAYAAGGRMVAVFNENGQYFAIDDLCPHMGASLAAGYVEDRMVSCPWHAWRFRIDDGTWCDNPKISVDHFPVRIRDGRIEVGIQPTDSPGQAPPGCGSGDCASSGDVTPDSDDS